MQKSELSLLNLANADVLAQETVIECSSGGSGTCYQKDSTTHVYCPSTGITENKCKANGTSSSSCSIRN